jgi:hypothetical protein
MRFSTLFSFGVIFLSNVHTEKLNYVLFVIYEKGKEKNMEELFIHLMGLLQLS